ncbi:FkbM family methyltransferase [Dokdonella fugitiva]|uniref:FkbM family methyltransferase n=1 Tax=Dokdonella fugitiva TaxID=328517 RepID=A0A4R2IEG2_9GAMM|nr:FkbM family methyltransferase [Dokdonella fugitiva]
MSNSLKPDATDATHSPPNTPELERLRRVWETLGRDDPLWAVLSHRDKRGRRWDLDEFLATGSLEVDAQLAVLSARGYPRGRALALDFGCGAGRLTRALAAHFERAIGVDVSSTMVETARRLNADVANVEFRRNASARIEGIADASVDFVFSHITLQHIPADLAAGYVDEFFRILAPGGVAAFQFVDSHDDSLRGRLFGVASNRWLNPLRRILWRSRDVFEMHALAERRLHALLAWRPQLRLLDAIDDGAAGPGWRGRRWIVANDEAAPVRVDRTGYALYADPRDEHIGAPLLAGAAHDPHVLAVLQERLREGDVMLDVGANIGAIALPAASLVGPRGRVIAVEPIAANRVLLARAAQYAGFRQVEVVAAAAADHDGEIVLRTHPSTSNSATPPASGERLAAPEGASVRVRARALDGLFADLARLDLVKIDVEGMEPFVLRGMAGLLRRFRPAVLTEFHPWAIERATGTSPEDYLAGLFALHAVAEVLHRDGTRERCTDPAAVMAAWRRVNDAAGLAGRVHLDLLFAG